MIRLDLPKAHCDRLTINAHVNLPENVWSEMQEASFSIHPDDEKPAVFYGSRYVMNNKTHAVRSHIVGTDEPDEYHIQVRYVPQDIERPPRSLKSVNLLIDILVQHTESLSLECRARFRYNLRNRWTSRIPLPIPFFIGSDSAFTHIDGIRLSKREGEQLKYSIETSLSPSGVTLRHEVIMNIQAPLSRTVPREILRAARDVSRKLVVSTTEVDDDTKN